MKLRHAAALLACALALLTLFGCRTTGEELPPNIFAMSLGSDPETFDPAVMSGSVEGRVAYQIYEGLYTPAPGNGPPQPGVAERHEVSDDGTVYTFYLREDATWSNGDPVTAADFRYSYLRILRGDVAADYISFMRYLKNGRAFENGEVDEDAVGVRVVDDRTLVLELEEPVPYFLDVITFYTYFPVHRGSIEEHGQEDAFRDDTIVTNGPFRMTEYLRRNRVTLERNPHYWDAENVHLDEVRLVIIEDLAANVTAYLDGRIDWTDNLPNNQLSALKAREDFISDDWLGTYYYRFNVTEPPLDDVRVRRALMLALNREELCNCSLDGLYNPSTGFVPPIPGYEGVNSVRYDPEDARELLAEAGYPGGEGFPSLEILYNTSENHRTIAQAVQDMWSVELGIEVTLLNQEWKVYLETVEALDYQVGRAGWIGDYVDANTFLELWRSDDENNNTGWVNEEYDALIASSISETDPARRQELLLQAESLLLSEAVVMPIYYYAQFHLLRPSVRGWEMNVKNVHLARYVYKED